MLSAFVVVTQTTRLFSQLLNLDLNLGTTLPLGEHEPTCVRRHSHNDSSPTDVSPTEISPIIDIKWPYPRFKLG